jgi:hypothetical protein
VLTGCYNSSGNTHANIQVAEYEAQPHIPYVFIMLEVYTYQQAPAALYTMLYLLIGSFILEMIFRLSRRTGKINL